MRDQPWAVAYFGDIQLIAAALIAGIASVIDGDTLDIHGKRIRLHGIDAPESAQICNRQGRSWRCGQASAAALDDYLARRPVSCTAMGEDRYERTIGRCTVGGVDIEAWMVENGWAMDYAKYSYGEYSGNEQRAKAEQRGIWASEFQPPWEWRHRNR